MHRMLCATPKSNRMHFLQDLVAAAVLLEKLRKEAEASRQLAENAAAALTYGVDRKADRAHAIDVVNRLVQLQNVRPDV